MGGFHQVGPYHSGRASRHGQERARNEHRFRRRPAIRSRRRDGIETGSPPARRWHFSALKCPPISWRPVSLPRIEDQFGNPAWAEISQQEFRQARTCRCRAAKPSALHRRHARSHHRALRSVPAGSAAEGDRRHRYRLSPAASGQRQEQQRQPRPGDLGNQPRTKAAREGIECPRHRPFAAQPCGRAARGQAPSALGPT